MKVTNYELARLIRDLLRIAQVAMPPKLYAQDRRIQAAYVMLDNLNASQHRPPAQVDLSAEELPADRHRAPDQMVLDVLSKLDSVPAPDPQVAAALDLFLSEEGAPAMRHQAIEHILRDWFVGHGYIVERSQDDPYH